jgi:hypothetical protein
MSKLMKGKRKEKKELVKREAGIKYTKPYSVFKVRWSLTISGK